MGASCSKNDSSDVVVPSAHTPAPGNGLTTSISSSDFRSYLSACESDSQLRDFDSALRQQATSMVATFSESQQVGALSLESLRAVTGCLSEVNHEVVRFVLNSNRDAWKSQELFDLVQQYFDYSDKVLAFFNSLNSCLRAAQHRELLIKLALGHFEEESKVVNGVQGGDNSSVRFARTLQELRNFKEEGSPFSNDFFESLESLQFLQMEMLNKLKAKQRKLSNKMKSVKLYKRISLVIFAACFVGVIVFSVVAAAIAAPPLVTAIAAAMAAPMGGMGKWLNSLWNKYQTELKAQSQVIDTVGWRTVLTLEELKTIGSLVSKLQIQIEGFLTTAEFTIRDDSTVKVVIADMRDKLGGLTMAIAELEERTTLYTRDIRQGRTVILQGINRTASNGF